MNDNRKNIIKWLNDPVPSKIIYTIFVYSEKNRYFTQSDLQNLLYSVNSKNINNSISRYVEKLNGLFWKLDEDNIEYYPYNGCNKDNDISWGFKKVKKGKPIIPNFKWLEKLYNIKINNLDATKLFSFYNGLKDIKNKIDYDEFPGHKDTNILKLLKNGYEISYFLDKMGDVIFKSNWKKVQKEYAKLSIDYSGKKFNEKISEICNKFGVMVDEYNKSLIYVMLVYNSNSIFSCPELDKLFILIWKDYKEKPKSENLAFLTISDILVFMLGKRS